MIFFEGFYLFERESVCVCAPAGRVAEEQGDSPLSTELDTTRSQDPEITT